LYFTLNSAASLLRADVFSDTAKEAMQGQHPASVAASFDQTPQTAFKSFFISKHRTILPLI
jgi:hypothetical protein